jgi:hypothetical protein
MGAIWRRTGAGVAGVLLASALAGCTSTEGTETMPGQEPVPTSANGPPESPGASPPLSSTELPTMSRPAKPPKTPTDLVPHDIVAGRVIRGGSGPCYQLLTDDDTQYALHSTAGITLTEGTYVRIRFAPLKIKVYCGPGRHVALLEATVLG